MSNDFSQDDVRVTEPKVEGIEREEYVYQEVIYQTEIRPLYGMSFLSCFPCCTTRIQYPEVVTRFGDPKDQSTLLDPGYDQNMLMLAGQQRGELLAAVRAGDMDLLRSMVNLKVDLVRSILEQENMFREILAQDNAEMTELFLAHVDIGAEITKLINEDTDEANVYIAKLVEVVDASLLDSSFVVNALDQNNLEAVRLLLNNANLMNVVTALIDEGKLDLLTILTGERPEIMLEACVIEVLNLAQVADVSQEENVVGEADELYADLDYY